MKKNPFKWDFGEHILYYNEYHHIEVIYQTPSDMKDEINASGV